MGRRCSNDCGFVLVMPMAPRTARPVSVRSTMSASLPFRQREYRPICCLRRLSDRILQIEAFIAPVRCAAGVGRGCRYTRPRPAPRACFPSEGSGTLPKTRNDPRGLRVLVLDPGCDSIAGHHYAYDEALRDYCAGRGIPFRVFGPTVRPAVMERLGGKAHFRTALYVAQRNEVEVLKAAGAGNQMFFEDLQQLGEPGAQTLIVMHTVTHLHLAGLAAWLQSLRAKPRVRLTLRYPPDFYVIDKDAGPLAGSLYRHALRAIAKAAPGARFFSDTTGLAERYARASGVAFGYLPNPAHFAAPAAADEPAGERPSHFLFIGEARLEKGYRLLPEAIRLALGRAPQLRFTIRVNRGLEAIDAELRALAQGGAVQFTSGLPLPEAKYVQALQQADAVLLPYRPEHYRLRASALVVDTLSAARCPIVSAGTSLEAELRAHDPLPGAVMEGFSATALARAILQFDQRRAPLRAAAARAAPAVRALHSPARYFATLVGEAA